jgi:hypothetical protein
MRGKLIKTDNGYILDGDNLPNPRRLSIQNCNEIFGVVDVEKLAEENYPSGDDWSNEQSLFRKLAFINGFNKAMELNKDKLFTLSDISYAIAFSGKMKPSQIVKNLLEQPTEIDVEVVMDKIPADLAPGGWDVFPRLDKEGCLILKRVICM